jgi:Fe(3+) dicitrate transport protein
MTRLIAVFAILFLAGLRLDAQIPRAETGHPEAKPEAGVQLRFIVQDATGAPVPGALVEVAANSGRVWRAETDLAGECRVAPSSASDFQVTVRSRGMALWRGEVDRASAQQPVSVRLQPAAVTQELVVAAGLLTPTPEIIARTPGSVDVLEAATLRESRVFTVEEALRKLPGVFARPEEGFGLRPNIGIRGLNPTRSTRVLLLEDGVPLAYAPYGDNASYYHPPIDRYESVELIKGSGQISQGPMTVGGVVNYVTPAVPDRPAGSIAVTGGNRDYVNAHARYGGTWKGFGLLLDGIRKQGEGARDNVRSGLSDFTTKMNWSPAANHAFIGKVNHYREDSRVTYSGLRLDEWLADPRQNPFRNDSFEGRRTGVSLSHLWSVSPDAILTTTAYGAVFARDWWRQSSNSGQRPNTAANPLCGGMQNLHTTCGNEGRLRHYSTWGVDPRLRLAHSLFGVRNELDAGFRLHFEVQERLQVNGDTPLARTGSVVEDNRRGTQAYSGYLQNRFFLGALVLTPGLRLENVHYQRTNRLFNNNMGVTGDTSLTQWIPGLGAAWTPSPRLTVFAGVHRGFAPPRAEDIINNSGGFVELDSELSWNTEVGVRTRLARHLSLESTFFRLDYSNQIIPASLAGGIGATLTSAGQTLHQGMEAAGRYEWRDIFGSGHALALRSAWTWLPVARFVGTRFSNVPGFSGVSVTGNRLPYAAESLLNTSAVWTTRRGISTLVEMVQTSRMFGDDLNTVNSTPDGQRGAIPGYVVWNATLNVPLEAQRTTAFFTIKNVGNRLFLVDRVRGMLPGSPRLIQTGLQFTF